MSLSRKQIEDVCLLGHSDKSKICRYLRNDELDSSVWLCQKLHDSSRKRIDSDVDYALGRGERVVPSGDNCPGYPVLKYIIQGYDVGS